jgi:Mg-chelatase subunit ChlD
MDSLDDGYEFGILGFQQLDSGPNFIRWPVTGLSTMSNTTRHQANRFLEGMKDDFKGSSPLLAGISQALESPAQAIVLFSDGLPNPSFNEGLNANRLVRRVIQLNYAHKEIHAVTIGDYYKYRGTVEFMERLAKNNGGSFLAVSD